MAIDPAFLRAHRELYPGRDFVIAARRRCASTARSSIKYGRGVGAHRRPHQPLQHDVRPVLHGRQPGRLRPRARVGRDPEDPRRRAHRSSRAARCPSSSPAASRRSRRTSCDAVRYARKIGYFAVQCATNGIRFAQEPELRHEGQGGRPAHGLPAVRRRRQRGQRAPQDRQPLRREAARDREPPRGRHRRHPRRHGRQRRQQRPGRQDRRVRDRRTPTRSPSSLPAGLASPAATRTSTTRPRTKQRYTLSHLAHDMKTQTGITEPMRDWFPLSALGPVLRPRRPARRAEADWGSMKCGCHPNCGIGTMLFVEQEDASRRCPCPSFLEHRAAARRTSRRITDAAQARSADARPQVGLALLQELRRPKASPTSLRPWQVAPDHDGHTRRQDRLRRSDADEFEWRVLFVAGMWFQDLFNYDFRRTEMCIIPYGTQMGEISFCAYNTGVGWRKIIEKMFQTATLAEWYKKNGRHEVYARGAQRAAAGAARPDGAVPALPPPARPGGRRRSARCRSRRRGQVTRSARCRAPSSRAARARGRPPPVETASSGSRPAEGDGRCARARRRPAAV